MLTIQDALTAYKTYARAEGKSEKTVVWVVSSVGYLAKFLGDERQDVAGITADDLRSFIRALKTKPRWATHPFTPPQQATVSPTTLNTYLRGVRNFFNFLAREGFNQNNPVAGMKLPKAPDLVVPTLSEKQMAKLLDQPDKSRNVGFRDYAIMLTYFDTTCRLSEIAELDADEIDFEQNQCRVMGKGKKQRTVPFGRRVAKALMRYQVKCRPQPVGTNQFFLKSDGRPLTAGRIEKIISDYGKLIGLRVYPHKIRHTSAVTYLRNGGDVFSLHRKLGHTSLDMTRHYTNLSDADVKNMHFKNSPADRLKM